MKSDIWTDMYGVCDVGVYVYVGERREVVVIFRLGVT